MIDFMATSSEVPPCYMFMPIRPPAPPPNSGVAGSLEEANAQFKRLNDGAKQPFHFSAADSDVLAEPGAAIGADAQADRGAAHSGDDDRGDAVLIRRRTLRSGS
jgi:hypothetical protein